MNVVTRPDPGNVFPTPTGAEVSLSEAARGRVSAAYLADLDRRGRGLAPYDPWLDLAQRAVLNDLITGRMHAAGFRPGQQDDQPHPIPPRDWRGACPRWADDALADHTGRLIWISVTVSDAPPVAALAEISRHATGGRDYRAEDRPLVAQIAARVAAGEKPWPVALELAAHALGGGTEDAKARRLIKHFKESTR